MYKNNKFCKVKYCHVQKMIKTVSYYHSVHERKIPLLDILIISCRTSILFYIGTKVFFTKHSILLQSSVLNKCIKTSLIFHDTLLRV